MSISMTSSGTSSVTIIGKNTIPAIARPASPRRTTAACLQARQKKGKKGSIVMFEQMITALN